VQNVMAQEEETFTGTIKAVSWNDEEEVIAVVLVVVTEEEDDEGNITSYTDEFPIVNDVMGKQLFKLDGQTVDVTGVFLEDEDGTVSLKVTSYIPFENNENEDVPEEPEE